MRKNLIKTKFPGIYYELDTKTKVKTYIARIKIVGIINTEQIVGYSNDTIRTNPSIAYEKRTKLINKIKNGESIKKLENPTLDVFFKIYAEYKKNMITEKRLYVHTCVYNKHVPTNLKNKKIKDITKDDLQKIVNTMIEQKYKPKTLHAIKDLFSPMFNYGIEIGIVDRNITKGLTFPKFDPNRYFEIEEDKAKALYKAILNLPDNQYRAMFLFLLRGRRAGEVLSLDWKNIDLVNKKYTIVDSQSKIRKTLSFILDDELFEAIECLEDKKEGLVFYNKKTLKKYAKFPAAPWKRLKEKCEITDMKLHDFRHLLGFTLVNNGVSLENISRALGHSKISTTQQYSNQKEKMASEAIDSYLGLMK